MTQPMGLDPGWEIGGPGGGGATFFPTFHPTDAQRLAIRCDMTGIYLSADGGDSWRQHNLTSSAGAFAFERDNRDVVYAGTTGLFRTDDFGDSWQQLLPTPAETLGRRYQGDHADFQFRLQPDSVYPSPGGSVAAILIHPEDRNVLFVAVNSRDKATLCRSVDRGATWAQAAALDARISGLFCAPANPRNIYAVTSMAVYTLSLAGEIETRQELPEGVCPAVRVAAGWDEDNDALRVYAVSGIEGEGGQQQGRGFVSHDGGTTWQSFDQHLAAMAEIPAADVGLSFACVVTSPTKSLTAYVVCDRFRDLNERQDIGTWYGILKTVDGGQSWTWVFKEGGGTGGYSVQDGIVADNVEDSWCTEAFGGGYVRVIDVGVFPANPDIAMFTDWYRTMKTEDGGASWTAQYSRSLPDGTCVSRGLNVTTTYGVHFDPFDPQHIAISYTDIAYWHTFDSGKTWRRSSVGIPHQWQNTCYCVQFDPKQKDKLWSAWGSYHDLPKLKMTRLEGWRQRAVGGVATSLDGGRTWQVTAAGLPEQAPTTCVLMDPSSEVGKRTLFATVYGTGVYKSVDDGNSWELKIDGVTQHAPNAWELVYGADGVLYLRHLRCAVRRWRGAPSVAGWSPVPVNGWRRELAACASAGAGSLPKQPGNGSMGRQASVPQPLVRCRGG